VIICNNLSFNLFFRFDHFRLLSLYFVLIRMYIYVCLLFLIHYSEVLICFILLFLSFREQEALWISFVQFAVLWFHFQFKSQTIVQFLATKPDLLDLRRPSLICLIQCFVWISFIPNSFIFMLLIGTSFIQLFRIGQSVW